MLAEHRLSFRTAFAPAIRIGEARAGLNWAQGSRGLNLKILLIEDHELFRAGIKLLLGDLAEHLAFREASSCEAALELADMEATDIVLLDFHLPGMDGLKAIDAVRSRFEHARIVVLSADEDPALIRRAIDAGAAGFVPKTSTHAVMLAALRLVLAGGVYLPPHAMTAAIGADARELPALIGTMTARQTDTLRLAMQGKANKLIARELEISEATVKAHLSAAFRTLGVRNRTEAVFAAANLGVAI